MKIYSKNTALVVTDPQNDFLSPEGVTWGMVGKNVTENNTVENIESLFKAAKENDIPVFISPHYYYPTDHGWKFKGTLEKAMHDIHMFDRKGPLNLAGMSANLCVEAHMREFLEQGYEVAVVKDATAAAQTPELGDGYASAVTNFGFMANAVWTTAEAVEAIKQAD